MKPIECKTQMEIIVAHLWKHGGWLPTHELQGVTTPFGFIGSAGHTRVRELARNECPEKLRDKVERRRGSEIGLNPKFEYFRYRPRLTPVGAAQERCRRFDADLSAEEILAI
jgi:hypothetical protein